MTKPRSLASTFLTLAFLSPSVALADTVDLRIDLIGQGLQFEPNYEAEFLINRSPTPSAYGQSSFSLSAQDVTVLSDTIPAPSVFPLVFSPGEISLDDPNVGAPADESVYDLGFRNALFPEPSPNFYTGTSAAPSFVDGTYLGFGFLGAGYTDHLYISSGPATTPITPTPEPSSIVFMLTGLSVAGRLLVRRNSKS